MSLWDRLRGRVSKPGGAAATEAIPSVRGSGTRLRATPADGAAASPALAPSFAPDAENTIAGTFRVKRVLGAGAMGTVYLVQHPSWNSEVAVKVPKAELIADAENRHRITVEAEAWTELGLHPNVAYCYYVQTIDGVLLLVVEYVDGGNLEGWIARHGQSATLKSKLDLAIQFCHALEHAHAKGTIHRDIKPSNVLLTKEGQLKLTDFGIARVGTTQAGNWTPIGGAPVDGTMVGIGTEDYMPPEQWESAQVDARADLYAFGVCLYELFCGKRPYIGRLVGSPQKAPDPRSVNPVLLPALCELLLQCVDWDQAQRPESAQVIRQRLCAQYEEQFKESSAYAEIPAFTLTAAALNNRALSYLTLGREPLAESAWRAALECDPMHLESTYNLGLIRWRRADITDAALASQLEHVHRAGGGWRALLMLGLVHLERGDSLQAEKALRACLAERPGDGEIAGHLACAQALAKNRALVEIAAEDFKPCSAAFSQDGQFILAGKSLDTGFATKVLHLIDSATLRTVKTLVAPNRTGTKVAFNADGKLALSAGGDAYSLSGGRHECHGGVCLWNVDSGQLIRTFEGHTREVRWVAFGIDSQRAFSASVTEVCIWHVPTGKCLKVIEAHGLAMSPNGRVLGSRSPYGASPEKLELVEIDTGRRLREFDISPTALAFDRDARLALVGGDGTLELLDIASGRRLRKFDGHVGRVESLAFSPDGGLALSACGSQPSRGASPDRTMRLWEVGSGRCVRTFNEHCDSVTAVAFSPDGQVVLSGSLDGGLRLWHLPSSKARQAPSQISQVEPLVALIQGRKERAMLLDGIEGALLRGEGGAASRLARKLEALPGERWTSQMAELRIRLASQCCPQGLKEVGTPVAFRGDGLEAITSVALSRDGRLAIAGSFNGHVVRKWDTATGQLLGTCAGHSAGVHAVAFSPTGPMCASASVDKTLRLWDAEGARAVHCLSAHSGVVCSVAFSPDGRHVLSGSQDQTLRLWDVATGECLRTLIGPKNIASSVAFGSNDLALSVAGKSLFLWNLSSGDSIGVLDGHTMGVRAVATSSDGRLALSGGYDTTVRLWDLQKQACICPLEGHTACVTALAFSPDGNWVISAGEDRTVRLWRLHSDGGSAVIHQAADAVSSISLSADATLLLVATPNRVNALPLLWERD